MGNIFNKKLSEDNYIFNVIEVNEIRHNATKNVLEDLSKLSLYHIDQLADEYFNNNNDQILVDNNNINTVSQNASDIEYEKEAKREAYKTELILYEVHKQLKRRYGDKIVDTPKWYWNNVGGTYCRIAILAFTMNEYLALWGTNIQQTGFSGYYSSMDVYDIMVTGKMYSFYAESKSSNPVIYTPDDKISYLKRNTSKVYKLEPYTYMIDLGQGTITPSFWNGIIAPFIFNNQDWKSLLGQMDVPFDLIKQELYDKITK